jgi:uncharacterized protein YbcV (DUF1398 family)
MSTNVIHKVLAESQAGWLVFPEVVRRLLEVGVESYFCDLARGEETFYMADDGPHVEKMTLSISPVAAEFSSTGIVAAIAGHRRLRSGIRSS